MTPASTDLDVRLLDADNAHELVRFANQAPLLRGDLASIAANLPSLTKVWMACDTDGAVHAAAIDDGLALSVTGDHAALAALAGAIPNVRDKLVVSGRTAECKAFVAPFADERRERPEAFMAVDAGQLVVAGPVSEVDLRVAGEADLPLLEAARQQALEEEYGIQLEPGGEMVSELRAAVARAVGMSGVAIWAVDGRIAFTAQLISKTPSAAMFGDLYTDPALRGEGRATAGLGVFCRWLMTESQHVTLRVGAENTPALKLYARTGFTRIDDFLSSLGGTR